MKLEPAKKSTYPTNPGVYRMLNDKDIIIYIGKAKNLQKRLASYFDKSAKSTRIKMMVADIKSIEVTITQTENDALILEQKLINKIKPKYNIIFRDDKSYPFISLSNHPYPKIFFTREKNVRHIRDNLFGPYPKGEAAYKNLEFIQKVFKLRTCTDNEFAHRSRPCMLHSIGKCSAPCMNKDSGVFTQEYQYSVSQAKKILNGQINPTLQSLNQKMNEYSKNLQYEEAAQMRDMMTSLKELNNNQTIYSLNEENVLVFNYFQMNQKIYLGHAKVMDGLPQEIFYIEIKNELKDFSIEELLTTYIEHELEKTGLLKIISPIQLPDLFYDHVGKKHTKQQDDWLLLVKTNLEKTFEENSRKNVHQENTLAQIHEIFIPDVFSLECIDISHFQGEATYGGKVRWSIKGNEGNLDKNKYRLAKFDDNKIDDIKHMYETVNTIYHTETDLPSILIIDGDKPQMQAAYKALKEKNLKKDFILLSSAKGVSRKKGVEIIHVHPSCQHLINPLYLEEGILKLPCENHFRLLLQHLQDTAHNFSNSARKKKMSKDRFKKEALHQT